MGARNRSFIGTRGGNSHFRRNLASRMFLNSCHHSKFRELISPIGSSPGPTSASCSCACTTTIRVSTRCCPTSGPTITLNPCSPIDSKNRDARRQSSVIDASDVAPTACPGSPPAPSTASQRVHPVVLIQTTPCPGRTLTLASRLSTHRSRGCLDIKIEISIHVRPYSKWPGLCEVAVVVGNNPFRVVGEMGPGTS